MRNTSETIRRHFSVYVIAIFFIFLPLFVHSLNTVVANQTLTSNQTIVSSGETFELGFFTPNHRHWYVGIWYKNIPDTDQVVVWVANRNSPLTNPSGVLKIGENGNILILLEDAAAKNNPNSIIWSTNLTSLSPPISPVAELLDSGNFILREEHNADPKHYLWQSFDYPTDTLLPEMKLGWDLKTGFQRYLTSWKTSDDPSSGDYSFRIDPHGYPETFLMKGDSRTYRSGAWNGVRFSGIPDQKPLPILNFNFEANQDEVSYSFTPKNYSVISRLVVNASTGVLQRFVWQEPSGWNLFWKFPKDMCDTYGLCGTNGVCSPNTSPACKCVQGFEPRNPKGWYSGRSSDGCVRNVELDCESDGFSLMENVKLPESSRSFVDQRMNITECGMMCRKNCSCTAYTNQDISDGGSGCVIWIGSLLDTREYAEGGQSIFIRTPASLLKTTGVKHEFKAVEIVTLIVGAAILMCGIIACCIYKRKALQSLFKREALHEGSRPLATEAVVLNRDPFDESKGEELELPLFNFSCVTLATGKFSDENKIGEGGFGCVYKGTLSDGQEVAIKRLSKTSGQGTEEFMNEVKLIARLQHRNLVRLLGCCIERDEKILIYEYLPHKSLANALFSREKRSLLDWKTRFGIICGIARGLLYLHQDSRYRIIHRDLKASNVLLDIELCPKISDFGLARIFGRDQTEANTGRVIGTFGYMAPEYAMDGIISVKSDVYSFGVLVLEIVSGKKNRGFHSSNHELNLLGHAWNLWKEQKGLEITDPSLSDSYSIYEVLRCIQVGLLCVQERAEDRPKMSSVVLMLSSETAIIPQPKHPGFCWRRNSLETDSSSSKQEVSCSVNQVTVTIPEGR